MDSRSWPCGVAAQSTFKLQLQVGKVRATREGAQTLLKAEGMGKGVGGHSRKHKGRTMQGVHRKGHSLWDCLPDGRRVERAAQEKAAGWARPRASRP